MCIMKSYETRGRDVLDPPPRRSNFTAHSPAGVMKLPKEWRKSDEYIEREHITYRYVCVYPYTCKVAVLT